MLRHNRCKEHTSQDDVSRTSYNPALCLTSTFSSSSSSLSVSPSLVVPLFCVCFFSLLFVCFFSLLPSLFLSVFPLSSLSSLRFLDFSWIPVTVFNPVSRRESQGKSQRPKRGKIEAQSWQHSCLQSFFFLRSRPFPLQVALSFIPKFHP